MPRLGTHLAVLTLFLAVAPRAGRAAELERAKELYGKTQYEEVLRLLETDRPNGAIENELIGKAYYHLGDYRKATQALEKAIQADPNNSDYFDWLGKIYGRRAETSSFMTAWSYAGKCRRNFERAIELNPQNLEAIDDLFEYSLNAPAMVGGGTDKAVQVAELARGVSTAKYLRLQARLAEKQRNFQREEGHLRKALEIAPRHLGCILDMAEFLARRDRYKESEAMFDRAEEVAPESAALKFERAKTYIQSGRNRDVARKLLLEYLNSSLTPDDPPRSEAERLLQTTSRT